jgi:hypothetical protein
MSSILFFIDPDNAKITNMAVSQIMNVLNFIFDRSRRAGVAPDEAGSSLHAGPEPGPGLDARDQAED